MLIYFMILSSVLSLTRFILSLLEKEKKFEFVCSSLSLILLFVNVYLVVTSFTNLNLLFLLINLVVFSIFNINLFEINIINIILLLIIFLSIIFTPIYFNEIRLENKRVEEENRILEEERQKELEKEYQKNVIWDEEYVAEERESYKLVFLANKTKNKQELDGSLDVSLIGKSMIVDGNMNAFMGMFDVYQFFYVLENRDVNEETIEAENIELEFTDNKEPSYDVITYTKYKRDYNVEPVKIVNSKSYTVDVLVISKSDFFMGTYLDFLYSEEVATSEIDDE